MVPGVHPLRAFAPIPPTQSGSREAISVVCDEGVDGVGDVRRAIEVVLEKIRGRERKGRGRKRDRESVLGVLGAPHPNTP